MTAFYQAGLIPNSVNIKQYTVTTYNGTVPSGSS